LRRISKIRLTFGMAGSKSAQSLEIVSVISAIGKFSRKVAMAGRVNIRSPIRLS
jgi:hypothetical protein